MIASDLGLATQPADPYTVTATEHKNFVFVLDILFQPRGQVVILFEPIKVRVDGFIVITTLPVLFRSQSVEIIGIHDDWKGNSFLSIFWPKKNDCGLLICRIT
jgi:hypothetical protein